MTGVNTEPVSIRLRDDMGRRKQACGLPQAGLRAVTVWDSYWKIHCVQRFWRTENACGALCCVMLEIGLYAVSITSLYSILFTPK